MDQQTLGKIASALFSREVAIATVPATYSGTTIPFHGVATIAGDHNGVTAEMVDTEGWYHESLRAAPPGTAIGPALFRTSAPGKLIGDAGRGIIVHDDGLWDAREVINVGHRLGFTRGVGNHTSFQFRVGEFVEHGPAYGEAIAIERHIFAGGEWNHVTEFFERQVAIRALSRDAKSIDDESLAITVLGELDEIDAEALWLWASLISGNIIAPVGIERFASSGQLISRSRRPGRPQTERFQYFRLPFVPFSPDGARDMLEGVSRLVRASFPINIVMAHLFESATHDVDFDGIHLTLAYHTAIEAWNRQNGAEFFVNPSTGAPMDDKAWANVTRPVRRSELVQAFYHDVGVELGQSVRSAHAHANRTTMAWRQRRLFQDLGIDVSGEDTKRILKMRNELLHNGYLVQRWTELTHDGRQQRYDDINRLRRLALIVLFRLTGYTGQYQDPLTYQALTLPAQSQGPVQP